jgi:hypothetical protein
MRLLKKLTCKGTSRHAFIRVYRLQLANFLRTFSHVGHKEVGGAEVGPLKLAPFFSSLLANLDKSLLAPQQEERSSEMLG